MRAYIPKADKQNTFTEATDKFTSMAIDMEVVSRPEWAPPSEKIRHKYISNCYNDIFRRAEKQDDEFFLMINRDIVLRGSVNNRPSEVDLMIAFISQNEKYALVGYDPCVRKREALGHMPVGLCVIRKKAIEGLVLEYNNDPCACCVLLKALQARKWKFGYAGEMVDGVMSSKEIRKELLHIKYLEDETNSRELYGR